jgi:hypothetical protein
MHGRAERAAPADPWDGTVREAQTVACCCCAADALSLSRSPPLPCCQCQCTSKGRLCRVRIITPKRQPYPTSEGEKESVWDRHGAAWQELPLAPPCLPFGGSGAHLHWWTPRNILRSCQLWFATPANERMCFIEKCTAQNKRFFVILNVDKIKN